MLPGAPTYSVTKIVEEAVARVCVRAFDLPVTIARMNAAYSSRGGLPAYHLDALVAGTPGGLGAHSTPARTARSTNANINVQVEPLLGAASVPATIVNWGGDDAVGPHDWCTLFGELTA